MQVQGYKGAFVLVIDGAPEMVSDRNGQEAVTFLYMDKKQLEQLQVACWQALFDNEIRELEKGEGI